MIICGYAGIGKSFLAKHYPMVMDLESTPFEKDWDRYFKCAMHYSDQGYIVLLSCHEAIREKVRWGITFQDRLTIFPCVEDKEIFRSRFIDRGNTPEFVENQMKNWEKWTSPANRLLGEHLEYMESGEYLLDTLKRLSKLEAHRFCNYDACPLSDCSKMGCVNPLSKFQDTPAEL